MEFLGLLGAVRSATQLILWAFPDRCHRLWRRFFPAVPPKEPQLSETGVVARRSLHRLLDTYSEVYRHAAEDLRYPLHADPFDRECDPPGFAMDCICSVVRSPDRRYVLLMPSAASKPVTGVGRTASLTHLLEMRLPYARLLSSHREAAALDKWQVLETTSAGTEPGWKLVASDMAYLTVDRGVLCAVPVRGERATPARENLVVGVA